MTISFTDARPFDSDQWENENQYTPSGRNFIHSGIVRARDGFSALNNLEVTPGSSGMQVDTDTGVAHLVGFRCELDTPGSNTLSNGDITNPRIDLIISKVDLSLNTRTIEVKEGTPAATPSAPAIVRNSSIYELPLMEILVPANETDINNCTFTPRYIYTDNIADHDVNLMMNVPSIELADGVQPIWFVTEDGTVALTEEDATGEGITSEFERVLKVVNSGTGGGKYVGQTFVFADEPTLTAEKTRVSATVEFWAANAGNITFELYDDGGAVSLASVTKEALPGGGWYRLFLEDVLVGTTSLTWRVSHDTDSVSYYFIKPVLNVGRKAMPWKPPSYVMRMALESAVWSTNPGSTNWADADFSPFTSPLTVGVFVEAAIVPDSGSGVQKGFVRRNGSSEAQSSATTIVRSNLSVVAGGSRFVQTDENGIIERSVDDTGITSFSGSLFAYLERES